LGQNGSAPRKDGIAAEGIPDVFIIAVVMPSLSDR
jgi:hypothetical protein